MELLPFATFLAAVTLTYLFCVRPMRRGIGCHVKRRGAGLDGE